MFPGSSVTSYPCGTHLRRSPPDRARKPIAALATLWLSALACPFSFTPASAQGIDTTLWVTDASVLAVARSGNTLYIGGGFTRVGPPTGTAVPIDATTGLVLALPRVTGDVNAVASDGAGGWYVGGNFTAVGGIARQNLARILSDNTVSAWNPGANNNVRALAVSGSTVYVGGDFTIIGGQTRNRIAALDATTGSATAWDPNADSQVRALAVSGSTVYAGGAYSSIGGQTRNRIAALDATTGSATAWNPNGDGIVFVLVVSGSEVYAGGTFSTIGGQTRSRIAALDATTGTATAWNPNANSDVYAVAVSGSTIYVGGNFNNVGGQGRNKIAALDATTGSPTAWNPNASADVFALVVSGSTVYAGGGFTIIGGQTRSRLAALDATTGNATAWNPNANSFVFGLGVSGSVVYAGGRFTSVGGQTRNRIAALDVTTGGVTAWNPDANGTVNTVVVSGSTVYVGGGFSNIGGQTRNRIAALDGITGNATAWDPNADNLVNVMAVSGSTVYAGGSFTNIGGQTRNRIAALDPTTGSATAWNPNADNPPQALAVSGSTVYVGGNFGVIGGQSRSRIAALDVTTGSATAWNPNATGIVNALAVNGGTVYAGGVFNLIGGQTRNRIAALDAATGTATSWDPNGNGNVNSLAVSGSTVYAGGAFTIIGGAPRNRIAALDAATGLATAWNPNPGVNAVNALALSGSTVYAAGVFSSVGVWPQSNLAAITASPALSGIVPASGGNAGPVTATLHGTGLASGASAKLTHSGQPDIVGTNLGYAADGTNLTATFDLNGALVGTWDVVVTTLDLQSATLSNGFTIETVEAPQLRVSVVGRSLIRHSKSTGYDLMIENTGNVDARGVPLWIAGVPLDATVTLDFPLGYPPPSSGEPDWSTVPLSFSSAGGSYLALVLPRVPPGTLRRRIYVSVPGAAHPPFQLTAAVTPPWVDGNQFRACLTNGGVTNPSCMGAQLDAINAYLAANPNLDALSGIAIWAKVAWQCEGAATLPAALAKAEQVLDYLSGPVEGGAAAGCEDVLVPWWREVLAVSVVGAIDPNDKLGAQGTLAAQQALPYTIRFENLPGATAPAQQVVVTDQLDPSKMELSTVSIDAITFDTRQIHPPPGLKSYSTRVDLRPGKNLLVDVAVSLDPFTHVMSWYFTSIDPVTGMAPDDPLAGFLPPNVTPPQGEGSVVFTVMSKAGLTNGTIISNAATILFDDPPTMNTPTWTNGFDNTAPASHVLPLAPTSTPPSILVTWTADGNPPDLRDFTIYVKEDNGPYRVWLQNTTATSDTLKPSTESPIHTFSFYSVARDQIGNVEAAPPVPDATTQSTVSVGEPGEAGVLALAGAWPNPAEGSLHVRLTLPSRERAMLELLDIAGRRVMKREIGSLGPGSHLLSLAPPSRLRPGLYFLRLSRGPQVFHARVAVIR